jgi:hypothetical protein
MRRTVTPTGEPVLSLYDHLLSARDTLDLKDELEIIEVRWSFIECVHVVPRREGIITRVWLQ